MRFGGEPGNGKVWQAGTGRTAQDTQQRDRQHKRVLRGWETAGQAGCGDMGRAEEQGGIGWDAREWGRILENGMG